MKAAVLHELGGIPRFEDFPDPVAQNEGEVVARVKAAPIKNIDKAMAAGLHYSQPYAKLPCVVGIDGVCELEDGSRILTGALPSYGMMAEKTVIMKARSMPIPADVDPAVAAALMNPGLSAWFALTWRAKLQPGETVLVMGATGVTGKLAIQFAKQLGAGRVVAAGRSKEVLEELPGLGADAVISLAQPDEKIKKDFGNEARQHPFDVVVDYVWGHPTEVLLEVLEGHDLEAEAHRTRYIEVGAMAGPTISLPASLLRSIGIEFYGQGGGSIPREEFMKVPTEILPRLLKMVAERKIQFDIEKIPLQEVEQAWQRTDLHGKRIVLIP